MAIQIRTANGNDLAFITDTAKKYTDQIGFIPRAAIERETKKGNILFGTLNDDDAGYLLVDPIHSSQHRTAIIVQAAVRMDAQRMGLGLALLKTLEANARQIGSNILQCRCRAELTANLFWRAAGFTAVAVVPAGKRRGGHLVYWRKAIAEGACLTRIPIEKQHRLPGGHFGHLQVDEKQIALFTP